jgi:NADH-quinone oxidoreductase subunit L
MTGALAVGSPAAALFHLLTHAAFKALLFLAAGAVIHAVGTNYLSRMGGLRRAMPVTFWSFVIGLGALAGLPPLAGFWSKESIVGAAQEAALHGSDTVPGWAAWLVLIAALSTVVATAWYATRMWRLVFFGASRSTGVVHAEGSWLMRGPVLVLAVPATVLGLVGLSEAVGGRLGNDGEPVVHLGAAVLLPLGLAALGVLLAWRRDASVDPADALPGRAVLSNAFGLDAVQDALVTRPVTALAGAVRRADESIVDGAIEATGAGAVGAGGLLARAHATSLPRAAVAVLGGAVLIGVAVLMLGVWA